MRRSTAFSSSASPSPNLPHDHILARRQLGRRFQRFVVRHCGKYFAWRPSAALLAQFPGVGFAEQFGYADAEAFYDLAESSKNWGSTGGKSAGVIGLFSARSSGPTSAAACSRATMTR